MLAIQKKGFLLFLKTMTKTGTVNKIIVTCCQKSGGSHSIITFPGAKRRCFIVSSQTPNPYGFTSVAIVERASVTPKCFASLLSFLEILSINARKRTSIPKVKAPCRFVQKGNSKGRYFKSIGLSGAL